MLCGVMWTVTFPATQCMQPFCQICQKMPTYNLVFDIELPEARFLNSEDLTRISLPPLPPAAARAGEELIRLKSSAP